jgi:hypothetical protein
MSRIGLKPWFRAGRGWYVTVDGKQIPLQVFDPDKLHEAHAALAALFTATPVNQVSGRAPPDWPARVERYLTHKAARNLKPKTLAGYRWNLGAFLARFGTTPAAGVTAEAIEAHALSCATWGPNQRRNFLCDVGAFLKWAGAPARTGEAGAGEFRRRERDCRGRALAWPWGRRGATSGGCSRSSGTPAPGRPRRAP